MSEEIKVGDYVRCLYAVNTEGTVVSIQRKLEIRPNNKDATFISDEDRFEKVNEVPNFGELAKSACKSNISEQTLTDLLSTIYKAGQAYRDRA